jgi:hypothetical protein
MRERNYKVIMTTFVFVSVIYVFSSCASHKKDTQYCRHYLLAMIFSPSFNLESYELDTQPLLLKYLTALEVYTKPNSRDLSSKKQKTLSPKDKDDINLLNLTINNLWPHKSHDGDTASSK